MEKEYEIDLMDIARLLLRNWIKIVLAGVVGAVIVGLITIFLITPKYQSTVKMVILNKQQVNITYTDIQTSTQLTNDCVEILGSRDLMSLVASNLDWEVTPQELLTNTSVTVPSDTRVLEVTVTDTDPQHAQQIAYSIYQNASQTFIDTLDVNAVNLIEEPVVPTYPSSPNKTKNIMLGGIAGVFIMCMILFIKKITNNMINTVDDVENVLNLTLLAAIPDVEQSEEGKKKRRKKRRFMRKINIPRRIMKSLGGGK